jgi:hypothetical protein
MIFELILFGVILLAVGYWATMFAMGRRDDVLHGHFVQDESSVEPAGLVAAPARRMPPVPPRRPVAAAPQASKDSLQALLTVIKRDLNDAAR